MMEHQGHSEDSERLWYLGNARFVGKEHKYALENVLNAISLSAA